MKLGKKPARHDKRTLHLADYLTSRLPTPPAEFGHEREVPYWGMLANDRAGDCVFAGAAHETMLWNREQGRTVGFADANVLGDYGAVTGYDPSDPSTDQGTVTIDALNYRRKVGMLDAAGARHKLGAFAALEPGNWSHLLVALYLFGCVGIGVEFPDSAMAQFDRGRPWSVVRGSRVDGGHYIPLVAFRGGLLWCVTWGRLQAITPQFFARYCDEAYALLSEESISAWGRSPEGFDLSALRADLVQVAA